MMFWQSGALVFYVAASILCLLAFFEKNAETLPHGLVFFIFALVFEAISRVTKGNHNGS